jgi:carbonic anhydrase/acetyltransferase-like protein (isoleucine patch superfamily)
LNKLKRLYFGLFPHRMKSDDFVERLREKGVDVGEGTHFFGPSKTEVDTQRPWMLHIGAYCKITSGVVILCHDYSRSVLRRVYGEVIGEAKETWIGDNVFIGMNSVVLMGSHIGDNVVVGAGCVVSGDVPSNTVVAGVPARVICTLDDYYKKRKVKSPVEGRKWARCFVKKYGRKPTEAEMGPFWWDFMPRDVAALREKGIFTHLSGDNEEELLQAFLTSEPRFGSYEEFLDDALCNDAGDN